MKSNIYLQKENERKTENEHIKLTFDYINSSSAETGVYYVYKLSDDIYSEHDALIDIYKIKDRTKIRSSVKYEHKVKSNFYNSLFITEKKYNYLMKDNQTVYYVNTLKDKSKIAIINLHKYKDEISKLEIKNKKIQFENTGYTNKVDKKMIEIPIKYFTVINLKKN